MIQRRLGMLWRSSPRLKATKKNVGKKGGGELWCRRRKSVVCRDVEDALSAQTLLERERSGCRQIYPHNSRSNRGLDKGQKYFKEVLPEISQRGENRCLALERGG